MTTKEKAAIIEDEALIVVMKAKIASIDGIAEMTDTTEVKDHTRPNTISPLKLITITTRSHQSTAKNQEKENKTRQ